MARRPPPATPPGTAPENASAHDPAAAAKEKKLAVALGYERGKDPAPRVVAKGQGTIAEQIVKIAKENDIEIREDAPLVEVLSALEVDSVIPLEAYAAVAEILTYVYKANRTLREEKFGRVLQPPGKRS